MKNYDFYREKVDFPIKILGDNLLSGDNSLSPTKTDQAFRREANSDYYKFKVESEIINEGRVAVSVTLRPGVYLA